MMRYVATIVGFLFPFLAASFAKMSVNIMQWDEFDRLLIGLFSPLFAVFIYSCPAWTWNKRND